MFKALTLGVLLASPLFASEAYSSSTDEFDINSISSYLDDDASEGNTDIKASVGTSYSYSNYNQGPSLSPTAQSSPTQSGFSPTAGALVASPYQSSSSSSSAYYSAGTPTLSGTSYDPAYQSSGSSLQSNTPYGSYNKGYQNSLPAQQGASYSITHGQGYQSSTSPQTSLIYGQKYPSSPVQSSSTYEASSYNGVHQDGAAGQLASSYGGLLQTGSKSQPPTGYSGNSQFSSPPSDHNTPVNNEYKSPSVPYKFTGSSNSDFHSYKPQPPLGNSVAGAPSHELDQSPYMNSGAHHNSFEGHGLPNRPPYSTEVSGPEGPPIPWGGDERPEPYSGYNSFPPNKHWYSHGSHRPSKDYPSYSQKGPHGDSYNGPDSYYVGYKPRPYSPHPGPHNRPPPSYRGSRHAEKYMSSRYPRHPRPTYSRKRPYPSVHSKHHSYRPGQFSSSYKPRV